MSKIFKSLIAVVVMGVATSTPALLVRFDNGTVKDTATNLIWMYDWGSSGPADWWTQQAWAEGLDFAGSQEWRLPTAYEFMEVIGAAGGRDALPTSFANVQFGHYWTGSEGFAPDQAITIRTDTLGRHSLPKDMPYFPAVAVRLPEPPAPALLLVALAAALLARRLANPFVGKQPRLRAWVVSEPVLRPGCRPAPARATLV